MPALNQYSRFKPHEGRSGGAVVNRKIAQVIIKGQRLTVCEKNLPASRTRFTACDLAGNVIYQGFLLFDEKTVQFSDAKSFPVASFDLASWEQVFFLH